MSKNLYLGVDIGGTYIRIVLLRGLRPQRPAVFKARSWHTAKKLELELRRHIDAVLGKDKKRLAGVGVSVAGIVDAQHGVLIKVYNISALNGWNIKKFFSYLDVPVRIENDVRCFLTGETKWGIGRGKKNLVGVAVGTGIGGAIVIDGKMYCGAHHSAGEIGFMVMRERPVKFFGDLAAKEAYERLGNRSRTIGLGISSIINTLDPEMVIIGGGAVQSKDFHLDVVVKTARTHLINPSAKKTPIVKGALGEGAQAIGAALLFAEK